MAIKPKQRRLSIVLSPQSTATSSAEKSDKTSLKRCGLPGPRPKSNHSTPTRQSNQQDQLLVNQFKTEDTHQIQQIKKHLNLIDSFNVLIHLSQQTILAFNPTQPNLPQDPNKVNHQRELEDSFYHLILFRFELWLGRIADHLPKSLYKFNQHNEVVNLKNRDDDYEIELTLDYLPPLDVLFVWYCYCFNSRNYYEDSLRLYPILKHLKFPLELAASEYDCSSPRTNYEKLKSKMKVENLQEAEALLKAIKTLSSSESVDKPSHGLEELKNPASLSSLLFPKNLKSEAGANAKNLWIQLTNTNFNLIDFINHPSYRTFICPFCSDTIESPFYVRDPGTNLVRVSDTCWSYSSETRSVSQPDVKQEHNDINNETQEEISIDKKPIVATHKNHAQLKCHNCSWVGIKQDLSLFRFASELKFCLSNKDNNNISETDPIDCLAGTLTTTENLNDMKNAIFFNNLLLQDESHAVFKHFNELNPSDTNLDCLNCLKKLQKTVKFVLNNNSVPFAQRNIIERSFHNLLKSYGVPEPFSVDLIRSMKIQRHFIRRMVQLGWTGVHSQEKKPVVIPQEEIDYRLQSCISRYNAFSNLVLTTQPHLILIPTSDIDLAWKTDRLRGVLYTESMMRNNKIMIDHPDEFDFDKSKFFDQFRLTSALWIHRYQIEYSRYPAPFVRSDRRQNWLKKALAHITLPESNCTDGVETSQEKPHRQLKPTQSPVQTTLTTEEMHSKLDSHEAAPNPRCRTASTGVIVRPTQSKNLNHKVSQPIIPLQTWSDAEETKGVLSPAESVMKPATTPELQLLEHKTAQISVASYFEDIYSAEGSLIKSSTLPLKVTPSKLSEQNTETSFHNTTEENDPAQKGKQVAQDEVASSSSDVDTLYSLSSYSPSTPMLENERGSGCKSEVTKQDPGVIHEAKKISIKFAEDAKNVNRPISKVYSLTERYHVKNDANRSSPSRPLPQTTRAPIKILRLDSPISQHQTGHDLIDSQESIKNKCQVDTKCTGKLVQKSDDTNPNWLKSIPNPAGSEVTQQQVEPIIRFDGKNLTIDSLHSKDHRLNHQNEPKITRMNPSQKTLNTKEKMEISHKLPLNFTTTITTTPTAVNEKRQKSQIENSNVLLVSMDQKNNHPSVTVSKPSDSLDHLDSSSPKMGFLEIPIGKIAFVEDGNKLRCL